MNDVKGTNLGAKKVIFFFMLIILISGTAIIMMVDGYSTFFQDLLNGDAVAGFVIAFFPAMAIVALILVLFLVLLKNVTKT